MRPMLDFKECINDSPRFRATLEESEADIEHLEIKLEKLAKLCSNFIDAGKSYNNANSAFILGVRGVSDYFREDPTVVEVLLKFARCLDEIQKFHTTLLDQAHRAICQNVSSFIQADIKRSKETRKYFERLSDDLDSAQVRHAQASRAKPQECEDARNALEAQRTCFQHTALDYVCQINLLHSKKRFDTQHTMLAYMQAQSTFFHQGSELFGDLELYMKQVAQQIEKLNDKAGLMQRDMDSRHSLVQKNKDGTSRVDNDGSKRIEGYLFKRTSNAFKSWVRTRRPAEEWTRRWFSIDNNQLVYRKRSRDNLTVMEDDLRLCTVKAVPEMERRYCFEVIAPTRSHILQAESDEDMNAWIVAIQDGVSRAYRDRAQSQKTSNSDGTGNVSPLESLTPTAARPTKMTSQTRMRQILALPGNDRCADCGDVEPRWSSINLGVTLCITCSGIHRGFGVHVSKVRSINLDAWEPEIFKVMTALGNTVVNRIYEANVPDEMPRATPKSSLDERSAWIRLKWLERAFVRALPRAEDVAQTECKWTVRKRRTTTKKKEGESGCCLPVVVLTAACAGASQDSGVCNASHDVIIFGDEGLEEKNDGPDGDKLENIDESEWSGSEDGGDADGRSTTSWEELSRLHPGLLLYRAAQARNLPVMREALAQGAEVDWVMDDEEAMTPLIRAVHSGSMAASEFLLLNGAKVDRKDAQGRSALHHATLLGHTGQVCQLLKRNANQHAVDANGNDPLAIAVEKANADIVTLLRLAKLNEDMKEEDGFYGAPDETFNDVFKDYTNMANNAPEKLQRPPPGPDECN